MDFARQAALQVADYARSVDTDQITFAFVPAAILLFSTPIYLAILLHNVRRAQPNPALHQQLVSRPTTCLRRLRALLTNNSFLLSQIITTCITATAIINAAIWYFSAIRNSIHAITIAIPAICALATLIRIFAQQATGKQPSLLYSACLSLTTIGDITATKNCLAFSGVMPIRIVSAIAVGLKFWLVVLDQAPNRTSASPGRLRRAIQPVKSYFWQCFFSLWIKAFRLSDDMCVRDFPALRAEFELSDLQRLFQLAWTHGRLPYRHFECVLLTLLLPSCKRQPLRASYYLPTSVQKIRLGVVCVPPSVRHLKALPIDFDTSYSAGY